MKKTYKYRTMFQQIEKIEIVKTTKKMVMAKNGLKYFKESSYYKFHDTWKEAHEYLKIKKEIEIVCLKTSIEWQEEELKKILKMKPL